MACSACHRQFTEKVFKKNKKMETTTNSQPIPDNRQIDCRIATELFLVKLHGRTAAATNILTTEWGYVSAPIFHYSTDLAASFRITEKFPVFIFRKDPVGFEASLGVFITTKPNAIGVPSTAINYFKAHAKTLPEAVALAALQYLDKKREMPNG